MEKALTALMNLGLAQTEARVYIYLAKKGSHTKEELAKVLSISNQHVRQSLNTLQRKGFITSKTINRAIYVAVPLERVIENIVKVETEAAKRLEQEKEKFFSN